MNNKCLIEYCFKGLMIIMLLQNVNALMTRNLPNIIFIMADDMGYGDVKAFNS